MLPVMCAAWHQACYAKHIASLRASGVRLDVKLYQPDVSSVTGRSLTNHDDACHKAKCLAQKLMGQSEAPTAAEGEVAVAISELPVSDPALQGESSTEGSAGQKRKDVPGAARARKRRRVDPHRNIIDKQHLLRACEGERDLLLIAVMLTGHADKQSVSVAANLLWNEKLQTRLRQLGYWRDAEALRLFGGAYSAMQMEGLTVDERTLRGERLHALVVAALHTELHDMAQGLASGDLFGIHRPLWLIWGQNVEARQSIIERFPDARANYVELSDDTNDVENEFRCIQNACVPHGIRCEHACMRKCVAVCAVVGSCGRNPTPHLYAPAQRNVEIVAQTARQTDEQRRWSYPPGKGSIYSSSGLHHVKHQRAADANVPLP